MFQVPVPVTPALALGTPPDLLRLLAVPIFAWAAYRDIRTRRVPNATWIPLFGLGIALLLWDGWLVAGASTYEQRLFGVRVAASLGIVAPLGYIFWRMGGFGGADAKAVIALAVLFPTYPVYYLPWDAWPSVRATLGVFSLTVLSNTVVLGALYPGVLAGRNLLAGRLSPAIFVGRPTSVERITDEYGRILETPEGLTRRGLDLDALRMYLRWRGTSLMEIRADPTRYRNPRSLPPESERNNPGDGSIGNPPVTDGESPGDTGRPGRTTDDTHNGSPGEESQEEIPRSQVATPAHDGDTLSPSMEPGETIEDTDRDDWGAKAFLEAVEGNAYGTTPAQLRSGLEVLVREDEVWITPGIPFVVPMFGGLVVALTFGDLLFAGLVAIGFT